MKTQTINLLKKEILLGNSLQTICWLVCCFGMFFIPNYPSYIGPFYITLSIMMTFALNQSSHDILYTVLLPVRKIDAVKARFLYCGMLELITLVFGIVVGLIRHFAAFPQNKAGIGITIAYFGLQMLVFAVFNFLFLGNVYKDPLKPGLRYLVAAITYFVVYAICEIPVWVYFSMESKLEKGKIAELPLIAEFGRRICSSNSTDLAPQLLILLGGFLIFAGSWYITFLRAAKQFEHYDL